MSRYKVMYLPVEDEVIDGSIVMGPDGEVYTYSEVDHFETGTTGLKTAKLFIVDYKYNLPVPIGRPSPEALKWLKAGMELRRPDCELWYYDARTMKCLVKVVPGAADSLPESIEEVVRVMCPLCKDLH